MIDILKSIRNCIVYKCMQDSSIECAMFRVNSNDFIAIEATRAEAMSLKNSLIVVEVGLIGKEI